jgi:hypothetical protein
VDRVKTPSAAQIAEQVWQELGVAQQLVEDVCVGSSGAVECLAGAEVLGAVQKVVGHRLVGLAAAGADGRVGLAYTMEVLGEWDVAGAELEEYCVAPWEGVGEVDVRAFQ